jgi:hypothetical protein
MVSGIVRQELWINELEFGYPSLYAMPSINIAQEEIS